MAISIVFYNWKLPAKWNYDQGYPIFKRDVYKGQTLLLFHLISLLR